MEPGLFSGFESAHVDVGETTIFLRRRGSGKPLLLLHGFPETHLMWHAVAPALAEKYTVICADLRGYGASGKPASRPDHTPYSKQALALDMVRLMAAQGSRPARHCDEQMRVSFSPSGAGRCWLSPSLCPNA